MRKHKCEILLSLMILVFCTMVFPYSAKAATRTMKYNWQSSINYAYDSGGVPYIYPTLASHYRSEDIDLTGVDTLSFHIYDTYGYARIFLCNTDTDEVVWQTPKQPAQGAYDLVTFNTRTLKGNYYIDVRVREDIHISSLVGTIKQLFMLSWIEATGQDLDEYYLDGWTDTSPYDIMSGSSGEYFCNVGANNSVSKYTRSPLLDFSKLSSLNFNIMSNSPSAGIAYCKVDIVDQGDNVILTLWDPWTNHEAYQSNFGMKVINLDDERYKDIKNIKGYILASRVASGMPLHLALSPLHIVEQKGPQTPQIQGLTGLTILL